jgi:hypothetical protein
MPPVSKSLTTDRQDGCERTWSGSRRRSSPPSSIRSKASTRSKAYEKDAVVDPVMPEVLETGDAGLLVTGDRLAVDDTGAQAQPGQGLYDQRELAG